MTRIGSTVCLKICVAGASMMIRLVIMSMDAMTYLLRHFSGLLTYCSSSIENYGF